MMRTKLSLLSIWLLLILVVSHADEALEEEMADALVRRDASAIADLVQRGVDVNGRMPLSGHQKVRTPYLHEAIRRHLYDSVELMLKSGADITLIGEEKTTALHLAARNGSEDLRMVRLLIRHGASATEYDSHLYQPIHWAVIQDRVGTVKLLSAAGADVDAWAGVPNARFTPLTLAAGKGRLGTVQALVDLGAKVDDLQGYLALSYAARKSALEVVRYLAEKGAPLEPKTSFPEEVLISTESPLVMAARTRQPGLIELLIESGADVNVKFTYDMGHETLLMRTVRHSSPSPEVLKSLLKGKPDLDAKGKFPWGGNGIVIPPADPVPDPWNESTALMQAAQHGNLEAVKLLVEAGATVDLRDNHGNSAIDLANGPQKEAIVEFLLSKSRQKSASSG